MNKRQLLTAASKQKQANVDYVISQCTPGRFPFTGRVGDWIDEKLCQKFQEELPADLGLLTWHEPLTFDEEPIETARNPTKPNKTRTVKIESDEMEWKPIGTRADGITQLEKYTVAKVTHSRMPRNEHWLELLFSGKHGLTQALLNDLFYHSPNTAYIDSERKITIVKKG